MTKKSSTRWFCCFWAVSLLMGMAGCGGGDKIPPLFKATGKVTLDDQPVSGATVTLLPEDTGSSFGLSVFGMTDDKGEFTLATNNIPGSPQGEFLVTVVKYEGSGAEEPPPADGKELKLDPLDLNANPMFKVMKDRKDKEKGSGTSSSLPAKYADRNTSQLTAKISSDPEKNTAALTIKLTSK